MWGERMKVLKETLLLNDLKSTLDVAKEESVLIMRSEASPVVILTLDEYNELKAKAYKSE